MGNESSIFGFAENGPLIIIVQFSHPSDVFGSFVSINKVCLRTICFMTEKDIFQWKDLVVSKSLSCACKGAIKCPALYPKVVIEKIVSDPNRKLFVDDAVMDFFVENLEVELVKKLFSREKKFLQIFVQKPRSIFLKTLTDMDIKEDDEDTIRRRRNEIFSILCRDFFSHYNLRFVRNFMDKFDDTLLDIIFHLPMKNNSANLNLSNSSEVVQGLWESRKTKHLLEIVENSLTDASSPTLLSTVHPCPELVVFAITTEKKELLKSYLEKVVVPNFLQVKERNRYGSNQYDIKLEEILITFPSVPEEEETTESDIETRFYELFKMALETNFFTVTSDTLLSFIKFPKLLDVLMKYATGDEFEEFVDKLMSTSKTEKLSPDIICSIIDSLITLDHGGSCVGPIAELLKFGYDDVVISHLLNFEKIDSVNRNFPPFKGKSLSSDRNQSAKKMMRGNRILSDLLEACVSYISSIEVSKKVTEEILQLISTNQMEVISEKAMINSFKHPSSQLRKKLLEQPNVYSSLVFSEARCSLVLFSLLEGSGVEKEEEEDEHEGEEEEDREARKVKKFCLCLMENKKVRWEIDDRNLHDNIDKLIEIPFFKHILKGYHPSNVLKFTQILTCFTNNRGGGDSDSATKGLKMKYVECLISEMIEREKWRAMYWLYFDNKKYSKERAKIIQNLSSAFHRPGELTTMKCARYAKCKTVLDFADDEMNWFECYYCTEKMNWKGLIHYGHNTELNGVQVPKIFCMKCVEEHVANERIIRKGMRRRRDYRKVKCLRCLDCKNKKGKEGPGFT